MQGKIIHAFLNTLMHHRIRDITLDLVAHKAGVDVSQIMSLGQSVSDLYDVFLKTQEDALFYALPVANLLGSPERDALLEFMATRFEVMRPYRYFYAFLEKGLLQSGDLSLLCLGHEYRSFMCGMRHYGLLQENLLDHIKRHGAFSIYIMALQSWIHDPTPDHESTLETLDGLLLKGEKFLERY